jgi:hypothetical protein
LGKGNSRLIALVLAVLVTMALTGPMAWAAPVPSQSSVGTAEQVDAKAVAAERELVKGKLMNFGLAEKDASGRVDLLTDQEVHSLASHLDTVQIAGDNIQWDTTTVLLVVILAVLIL